MMKTKMSHLFYTFLIITGIILAVLGVVVGQLFPFFADQYSEKHYAVLESEVTEILNENPSLTTSERERILDSLSISEEGDKEILRGETTRITFAVGIVLLCAYIIFWVVTKLVLKNFLLGIVNVIDTAKQLGKGNYRARAFTNGSPFIVDLRDSVNSLANNLENITKTRLIEDERLKTLVETMGSALLMMNREGHVIIANRIFLNNFQMEHDDTIGKSFLALNIPEPIKLFIDQVFLSEQPERKQISFELNQELKHKQVFGAPVVGENGKWLGIVIVLHDITELVRLEQVRQDFVANVSHELRTPITSIKGFSETLLDGAYKDEVMLTSFLEIIHKESERLQSLVNDLLDLSKLEQHGYEIEKSDVSIQQALAHVVDVASSKVEEKNIQLEVDLKNDIHVLGENNRLIQIFTNLLNNAIMYSSEHSTIKIIGYQDEEYGAVEIIDEGVGIPEAEISRVFERFYRVDTARSRNSGGTGLGLAIVKHLVELHNGKIDVESTFGEGTTMRIKIPLLK